MPVLVVMMFLTMILAVLMLVTMLVVAMLMAAVRALRVVQRPTVRVQNLHMFARDGISLIESLRVQLRQLLLRHGDLADVVPFVPSIHF